MDLKCRLETRTSKKDNKPYDVIVINLTDSYEKLVYPDPAEKELIKLSGKDDSSKKEVVNPFKIN